MRQPHRGGLAWKGNLMATLNTLGFLVDPWDRIERPLDPWIVEVWSVTDSFNGADVRSAI